MSNSVSIDILFKFKEEGENFLKKLEEGLSFSNIEKSFEKSFKNIEDRLSKSIGTNVLKGIEESISKIDFKSIIDPLNSVADSLEYITSLIKKMGNVFSGTMDDAGNKLKTQDAIIQSSTAKAQAYGSAIILWTYGPLKSLAEGVTSKKLITSYFDAIPGLAEKAGVGLKSVFSRYKTYFFDIVNVLSPSGLMKISGGGFLNAFSNIFISFSRLPLFAVFNKMLTGDLLEMGKRLIGMGNEALSPMGRMARLVTTIDSSVHNTAQNFGGLFKSIIYGAGIFVGFWSPISAGIGIAKNLIDSGLKSFSFRLSNITGIFGAVRGQMSIIFVGFRNFFFEIAKSGGILDALISRPWYAKLKALYGGQVGGSILDKISTFLKSGGFETFFSTIGKKIAEWEGRIKEFFFLVNRQLLTISEILAKMFSRMKTEALSSINEISQKTQGIFGAKKFSIFPGDTRSYFIGFFNSLESSLRKEFSNEHINKSFQTFLKKMFSYTGEIDFTKDTVSKIITHIYKSLDEEMKVVKGKTFGSKLSNIISAGLSGKNPELEGKVRLLVLDIENFLKNSMPALEKSGKQFSSFLGKGISSGKGELASSLEKSLAELAEQLPQSPAKKGPLVNLLKMGEKISLYLAEGMLDGKKSVHSATSQVVEGIAKFFPRSLPILGALTALPTMGFKIPFYIAQGIMKGAGLAYDALQEMTGELKLIIDGLINKIKEFRRIGSGAGISVETISALDFALKSLGSSASDASFSFAKLAEVIQKPTEENKEQLRLWEIDLEKIKQSGDPVLNLFFALSDVVARFGANSHSGRAAMSMMGQMMQSNLVPAMQKGSSEIKKLMGEFKQTGSTIQEEMQVYVEFKEKIETAWNALKESIVQKFLIPLAPIIKEKFEEIYEIWLQNSSKIGMAASVIGNAVRALLDFLLSFVSFAISEPKKASNIIYDVFSKITEFLLVEGSDFGQRVFGKILNFMMKLQISIITVSLTLVKNIFSNLWDEITTQLENKLEQYHPTKLPVLKQIAEVGHVINYPIRKATKSFQDFSKNLNPLKILEEKKDYKVDVEDPGGVRKSSMDSWKSLNPPILKSIEQDVKFSAENITKSAIDAVKKTIPELEKQMSELMGTINSGISETATTEYKEKLKKNWDTLIVDLGNATSSATPELKGKAQEFLDALNPEKIAKAIEDGYKKAEEATRQGIEGVKNAMSGAGGAEVEAFGGGFDTKFNMFDDPVKKADVFKEKLNGINEALSSLGNATGTLGQAFGDMYEATGKKAKEFFYMQKAMAMASAVVNIAQGITKALAAGGILGIIEGAIISATGAMQLGIITAQTIAGPSGYALGGRVEGPSGYDAVPAKLTKNEYVQPVSAVSYYGVNFMEALRRRMIPNEWTQNLVSGLPNFSALAPAGAFNTGGIVSSSQDSGKKETTSITMINAIEKSEIVDIMASQPGQNIILNAIKLNSGTIKRYLNI